MSDQKFKRVSLALQRIATEVNAGLRNAAGEECAFLLITQTSEGVVQYIGNASRPDAALLMRTQLEHWEKGMADIPAHYNPDLASPTPPKEPI